MYVPLINKLLLECESVHLLMYHLQLLLCYRDRGKYS